MYPVMLDLRDRSVVVIGGGPVAARKALSLVEAGASVVVVAPAVDEELDALEAGGDVTVIRRRFEPGDCRERVLAFAATDDADVNDSVVRAARGFGCLVCVSGPATETGSFAVPAVFNDGPITIAVATGNPALTVHLRDSLAGWLGPRWRRGAELLSQVRQLLRDRGTQVERAQFWRALVEELPDAVSNDESTRGWLLAERGPIVLDPEEVDTILSLY